MQPLVPTDFWIFSPTILLCQIADKEEGLKGYYTSVWELFEVVHLNSSVAKSSSNVYKSFALHLIWGHWFLQSSDWPYFSYNHLRRWLVMGRLVWFTKLASSIAKRWWPLRRSCKIRGSRSDSNMLMSMFLLWSKLKILSLCLPYGLCSKSKILFQLQFWFPMIVNQQYLMIELFSHIPSVLI